MKTRLPLTAIAHSTTKSFAAAAIATLVVPVITAAIAAPAIAQAPPKVDCNNPSSNIEYKYCARLAYEQSDRELNQVYKRVTTGMNRSQKDLLVTAQLNWIKFRDNNCEAETYLSRGGTGHEGFRHNCLERMTRARTAELVAQFEQQR